MSFAGTGGLFEGMGHGVPTGRATVNREGARVMSRMMFVNLPVADVAASREFFIGLGLTINDQMSNESTASLWVNDMTIVMLLSKERFAEFIVDDICDTATSREVLIAVSATSREDVDAMCDKAISLGATAWMDAQDHGFMYGRSFRDLDGHVWEVMSMDSPADTSTV